MSVRSLGYVGLQVQDPAAFHAFAVDVLGLMASTDADGVHRYRVDEYDWRFQVRQGDVDEMDFAGFEVANAAELAAVAERLRNGGVAVEAGEESLCAKRGVLGLIRCQDPEGIPVEIYFGPTLRTDKPFVSPVGVGQFVTGIEGLGHLALACKDIDANRHFFGDLLGFRPTDEIHLQFGPEFKLRLEFLHCNQRHHTLALAPFPAPTRLQHVMLEVASIDDVGRALYRAIDAGLTIAQSIGRHSNDRMLSFYVVSPAGFQFEFGYGAIKVYDETWSVGLHDVGSAWGHRPPPGVTEPSM